ncbi:MAG: ribosomal RNA small subunit methyltransferase A [Candidatus Komeilibacteria bacterium CG11_big_fil_rev_8_21_14_0_20_36_20]|uniref:Ribosomal RNA small subunit methyltransferase A n=1 Tax=Candidatus Komeilibacteria bacterium CG11_big_fil_rev_8_21_14_0_20_36_20 TaxID=1974477 RepID=A0A2H0NEV4_9BACT|nr:MAG: ribosomal RNA small subunit methyltransferase A [Candidatus Komeilibacteria bacterium CG11_big_fil_rev_8_21_14_0_20_36_20]PIR81511.1 MAG: ribosomal RNA small subunit methyltransferase A [Candidatus Komeilibacteria bacterium CG10_big_fil_rev_8_21_14_0_10_36_65]PJC55713.1 MAG: ribosomal RNA small subunit methyltransferase A [Candidatus Komeilibacteria bacterium CG_4_9_14_0_2_um_filter_36_13]
MNLSEVKFLLKKYHFSPNKIRGQNFLISDDPLQEMIKTANIKKEDLILEVGAGLGALTTELIKRSQKVVAFEVEKNFRPLLQNLTQVNHNLRIVWQNILSLSDQQLKDILIKEKASVYKIVANIPYYLTAKFIRQFILTRHKPQSMTLMVQKEVAERITVKNKKHSLLSLSVALYAQSKLVRIIAKDNFYPSPKVDSAIIYIYDIHSWNYSIEERKFWQLVHRGFASKRKKLFNNLLTDQDLTKEKLNLAFAKINLDKNIRAEDLTVSNWLQLIYYLERH